MQIVASANGLSKEAYIKFDNEASNGFDINDAYKMIGDNEQIAEPYLVVDSNAIVINVIKTTPYECPMNVHTQTAGTVTLAFANIPEGTNAVLVDDTTEIALTNATEYTTTIQSGENANRFKIRFKSEIGLSDAPQVQNTIDLWIAKRIINVTGENLQQLHIYNVLGQEVFAAKLTGISYTKELNLPQGAYTATVKAAKEVKTTKFVISE